MPIGKTTDIICVNPECCFLVHKRKYDTCIMLNEDMNKDELTVKIIKARDIYHSFKCVVDSFELCSKII